MSKKEVASRREGEVRRADFFPRSFSELRREMDRLFEEFHPSFDRLPAIGRHGAARMPSIDETEDEKAYQVKMDLPGVDEKDVDITFADGMLTVKGEKKEEEEHKDKDVWRQERYWGSFQRSVRLPVEVDEGRIEAVFDKGVLTVTLPKSDAAKSKTRKIEVRKA